MAKNRLNSAGKVIFPRIKKNGKKLYFPIMFMEFNGEAHGRESYPHLPTNLSVNINSWKNQEFQYTDHYVHQEMMSMIYSVIRKPHDSRLWCAEHQYSAYLEEKEHWNGVSEFCVVNFSSMTAIHVDKEWSGCRVIKCDSKEIFYRQLRKFVNIINSRLAEEDPVRALMLKTYAQQNDLDSWFKIFDWNFLDWVKDWCDVVKSAEY